MAVFCAASLAAAPQDPELRRGRELVRDVQQALNAKGYQSGPADGVMGPLTRSALRTFQRDEGLEVSGRMTDETLERLGVEVPEHREGDRGRTGGVVGAVGSAGKTAGQAMGRAGEAAGRATATGATAAARGTASGAKAAGRGAATGAEATAEGAATGAKAVAGGVETGASAAAGGAKSVARGARNVLFGKTEDERIRDRVRKAFEQDRAIDPDHFGIEVDAGVVTLRFKEGTEREWNRAVVVAKRVEGVQRVQVRRPPR